MDDKGVPDNTGRIRQHTQGLVQEIRTWVELQIELAVVRFWERLERRSSRLLAVSSALLLGAIALVFVLLAGALWLGSILGHLSWGFLIIGGATGGVALIIHLVCRSSAPDEGQTAADASTDLETI